MHHRLLRVFLLLFAIIAPVISGHAEDLPLPARIGKTGVDLATALEQRKTTREYSPAKLKMEDLSAILWAANGINRPDGKRTAPSAFGRQYIDIYIVTDTGGYRYDAPGHKLTAVGGGNFKDRMARQSHVAASSHILVLAADMGKVPGSPEETKLNWAHSTAGAVAQNVHLMAAARGIGTGIVAGIKADEIRQSLQLSKDVVPLYVMPLGYLK